MARTGKSYFTPVLLIVAGVVLLLWNLVPSFSFARIFAAGWPWLLVAWGVFRLAEVAIARVRGAPLPRKLGFAHFLLVIMIVSAGMLSHGIYNDRWLHVEWGDNTRTFDFPVEMSMDVEADALVELTGLRGDIEIVPTDDSQVRVRGRKLVRAEDAAESESRERRAPLALMGQEGGVRLQYLPEGNPRPRLELTVEIPRAVRVAIGELSGRLSARELAGDITVQGSRASLEFRDMGGSLKIDLDRADRIEASGIGGAFTLEGSAEEVSLVEMAGPVRVEGNVFGEIVLADVAGEVEVLSKNSELTAAALTGMAELTGSRFELHGIEGPAVLRSRGSKRMLVREFTGPLEVTGQRADVELDASAPLTGDVRVHVERGDVEALLPESGYQLSGWTKRGRVDDEFGAGLEQKTQDQGVEFSFGGDGPKVTLEVDRGDLRLIRGSQS